MNILILILSGHCHAERRKSVRHTWLKRLLPNMTARFVVGNGPCIKEPNLWQLPADDSYAGLQEKVRLAYRYAVGPDGLQFDYLFKCDDDTYLVPERLQSAIATVELGQPHYIGRLCGTNNDYCHGGAGYFLSRWMVGVLGNTPLMAVDGEDGWVGLNCRQLVDTVECQRFCYHPDEWPTPDNDLITAHAARTPEAMFRCHARYLCARMTTA